MTTVDIDDAHVFPEDEGTDVSDDYEQQWSAGFFAGQHRHEDLLDYVATGLQLHPDQGDASLDILSGLAHILVDAEVEVQASSGNFSQTWRSGIGITVDVPDVYNLSLTSGATNHVFLAVDLSAGDGAYYEINSTGESPSDPFLKIGEYDHDADETELLNRGADIASAEELADLTDHVDAVEDELQANIDANSDDISTNAGDITSNASDISGNANDISANADDITDLDNQIPADLADRLRDVEGQADDNTEDIDRNASNIADLDDQIPADLADRLAAVEDELEIRAAVDVLAESEALPDWADAAIRYEQ